MTGAGRSDDDGYRALHDAAAVRVVGRDALRVVGPDAASYLQGQVSQDVEALAVGSSAESLLLSPQGKVEAFVRITRTGEDIFVVDTDAGWGEAVEARLRRFKLRVKADLEPLAWVCVAIRGPGAAGSVAAGVPDDPALVLTVDWPGFAGVDLLGPAPAGDPLTWAAPSAVRCGAEAWEAARIEAGVPVNGREITEGTIAAEVGLVGRTVSFTKGCFTGQELVARLDARGSKVARSLRAVVVGTPEGASGGGGRADEGIDRTEGEAETAGEEIPPVGAAVWTADGEHLVGTLSSVARSPGLGATVALATLHRRIVPPEAVSVRWTDPDGVERGRPAEARTLPLVG